MLEEYVEHRKVVVTRRSQFELLRELHFPPSVGPLHSAYPAHLRLQLHAGAYMVTPLSSFGPPRYHGEPEKLRRVVVDAARDTDPLYCALHRTKIAVVSHDHNVDPVGACVGGRGARGQAVGRAHRGEADQKRDTNLKSSQRTERIRDMPLFL